MADEAGKARAEKLREEIAKITGKKPKTPDDEKTERSLHDKVEERMRQLEREERQKKEQE